jgi:hypothetical protein
MSGTTCTMTQWHISKCQVQLAQWHNDTSQHVRNHLHTVSASQLEITESSATPGSEPPQISCCSLAYSVEPTTSPYPLATHTLTPCICKINFVILSCILRSVCLSVPLNASYWRKPHPTVTGFTKILWLWICCALFVVARMQCFQRVYKAVQRTPTCWNMLRNWTVAMHRPSGWQSSLCCEHSTKDFPLLCTGTLAVTVLRRLIAWTHKQNL